MNMEDRHPLPSAMRSWVLEELQRIEREHDVRVLYACESGSRAWGFASTDSDFDVRFIYVHRQDWYLRIDEPRDVIERPLTDELDISGWELRKTLRLLRNANPTLLEWLDSPLVYRAEPGALQALRGLARQFHSPQSLHWPDHLGCVVPHCWQAYWVLTLLIVSVVLINEAYFSGF
mgnify:CR=1 FL=1